MASFFTELKRRNVFKVGVVYAIVAWLIAQIIAVVHEPLHLPVWFDTAVIVLLLIGFPIAILFAWAFELTPEGIKTTKSVDPAESIRQSTGQKLNYIIIGVMALAIVFMFVDNYVLVDNVQVSDTEEQTEISNTPEVINVLSPTEIIEPVSNDPERLPNSVAILPCENLSLDPENAFFAAGIHESTLNQVAKISGLRVMARTSVMQYENNPLPIPEIAEALHVETVVECSVRYADDTVLITAQLIDGITGAHMWSDEFLRDLVDVFSVQVEVAKQIASAMQVQLLPEELERIERRPTQSEEAYQHYLYAMSLVDNAYADVRLTSLERAIEADPNFAEAYSQIAWAYSLGGDIDRAIEYAQKAIEIAPTLGRPYFALGSIYFDYYQRLEESQTLFKLGLEYSPNDANSLDNYCYQMVNITGDYEEAIRLCRRAVELDPTSSQKHYRLGYVLMRAGNLDEATEQFSEAIEIRPAFHTAHLYLGVAEFLKGNTDSARQHLDRGVQLLSPQSRTSVDYLAYLYGLLGDADQAESLLARLEGRFNEADRASGSTLGWGILGTRDKERALNEWKIVIDGYIDNGLPINIGRISRFRDNFLNDPMLEEPEFLVLRRRLGYEG